ncbi:division/cell wall cluster transcriptional repressor MraZ [Parasphaerochaeta coccoides]|uniref:Transcriptional regulator MraZ n=1 Tax=Parasphaerochaeta coccoides (strain ATCC BAA-1237 / DSM 17374 / SPN1) TaxID=760011 RepID=F4GKX1_PARC1|nr:division/cell wall cluster transcriptional repressor MraZ [Parasphaerochaeta coccoides]AEC01884.1 Protein mraZ [Parasphaerochaeta coccoides DSM 17374]
MLLTGEYRNTLDEKGRILIPSKLRAAIAGDTLIVTRGVENCLWLLLPEHFESLRRRIMDGPGAMFDNKLRLLQHFIIARAQECEIDKAGRINIPAILRESVQLTVREESVILGVSSYLELWNVKNYEAYFSMSEQDFAAASQALSEDLREDARRKE